MAAVQQAMMQQQAQQQFQQAQQAQHFHQHMLPYPPGVPGGHPFPGAPWPRPPSAPSPWGGQQMSAGLLPPGPAAAQPGAGMLVPPGTLARAGPSGYGALGAAAAGLSLQGTATGATGLDGTKSAQATEAQSKREARQQVGPPSLFCPSLRVLGPPMHAAHPSCPLENHSRVPGIIPCTCRPTYCPLPRPCWPLMHPWKELLPTPGIAHTPLFPPPPTLQALNKYKEKRKNLNASNKIRYQARKVRCGCWAQCVHAG